MSKATWTYGLSAGLLLLLLEVIHFKTMIHDLSFDSKKNSFERLGQSLTQIAIELLYFYNKINSNSISLWHVQSERPNE
ncbi:MAG: hypothetical protein ACI83W_000894 [Marinoscillum sp.]|jgi:hypothetical protein